MLLRVRDWWLRSPTGSLRPVAVRQAKVHGEGLVAALAECADRDQAQALKGTVLAVSRARFPAQAEGEYYWIDLIGCAVRNPGQVALGEVVGVEEFGADPVLRVAGPDGVERLIPFVGALVERVDLAARELVVDWGLDY